MSLETLNRVHAERSEDQPQKISRADELVIGDVLINTSGKQKILNITDDTLGKIVFITEAGRSPAYDADEGPFGIVARSE